MSLIPEGFEVVNGQLVKISAGYTVEEAIWRSSCGITYGVSTSDCTSCGDSFNLDSNLVGYVVTTDAEDFALASNGEVQACPSCGKTLVKLKSVSSPISCPACASRDVVKVEIATTDKKPRVVREVGTDPLLADERHVARASAARRTAERISDTFWWLSWKSVIIAVAVVMLVGLGIWYAIYLTNKRIVVEASVTEFYWSRSIPMEREVNTRSGKKDLPKDIPKGAIRTKEYPIKDKIPDPSGAVIPGKRVECKSTDTKTGYKKTANECYEMVPKMIDGIILKYDWELWEWIAVENPPFASNHDRNPYWPSTPQLRQHERFTCQGGGCPQEYKVFFRRADGSVFEQLYDESEWRSLENGETYILTWNGWYKLLSTVKKPKTAMPK